MRYHLLSLPRYVYFILSASFAEHMNLLKVYFLDYINLVVIVERFVSTCMRQLTVCLSLC